MGQHKTEAGVPILERPALKTWFLSARDLEAVPFCFQGVAHTVFVAAPDEKAARALAFVECSHECWGDPRLTTCVEFRPQFPGVIVAVC